MIHRLLNPLLSNSFFLFGPRGTGKTTFLKALFAKEKTLWIDLLNPETEERYAVRPQELSQEIEIYKDKVSWVVIDEIQKVPKLLDLVHYHIEASGMKFALTGSSARKLKRGAANLLAGRAFVNYLFPLTHIELGSEFDLSNALCWGTLPRITQLTNSEEKSAFLRAYALTYLKEEIWAEHIVRKLDPFRRFLEVAAQTSGEIINYSNVARDVRADTKTVQSYFQVLEDTLLGVILEPFHESVRKRQTCHPKFYLFDLGVKRALEHTLEQTFNESSYDFGKLFEHFVILEAHRFNTYFNKDYRFSYLRTKDDAEIDLIVERPGRPLALVEIKSSTQVDERDTRTIDLFLKDFKNAQGFCLSRDPHSKKIGSVLALPWDQGLQELGLKAK